ncbi:MAG TPA: SIS domain-containing protein, partial [Stenomitos sp.]
MSSLLDDATRLTASDPGDMLGFLHRLPDMAQGAFERGRATRLPTLKPRQVLICGMGGSAISGDLARNLFFGRSEVPIAVSRHCSLPASMGAEDLVILLSYSGNTAETLGCLQDAIARRVPCVLVTSGGQFKALAEAHSLPTVAVEPGWMPRAALGELYFALLGLLSQLPGCAIDPAKAIAQLKRERDTYLLSVAAGQNPAKQIA